MVAQNELALSEVLGLGEGASDRETSRKLVCFYTAQGVSREDICHKLGMSEAAVDVIVTSQAGAAEIVRMQGLLYRNPRDRVNRIAPIAVDKLTRILLTSKDDKLIATVAEKLLDRSMGKATQVIENRNFNFDAKDLDAVDNALKVQMNRMEELEQMRNRLKEAETSKDIIDA